MALLIDQCGREVNLPQTPRRIICTVPSITELLYYLGLEQQVVGITAYCVHPKHWLKEKTVIGGTKNLQIEKIKKLQPDLIIANKEENVKEQIESLEREIPVWLTDVVSLNDALQMIADVSNITGKNNEGEQLLQQVRGQLASFEKVRRKISVATLIWKNPYMAVSGNTYTNAMMELVGMENIFAESRHRYPEISVKTLQEKKPELILLTSEPYSFNSLDMRQLSAYIGCAKYRIVDGEYFTWYGSRITKALPYLKRLQQDLALHFSHL